MKQLTLIALLFFTMSYGQHINLMTYNIRYDNPKDGENAWPNRKETLLNQILFYQPDIMGTQEGLEHQINYLDENLKSYKYVGVARADVKEKGKGEYSAVFYNVNKFKDLKSGTFWLSDTPDNHPEAGMLHSTEYVLISFYRIKILVINSGFSTLILIIKELRQDKNQQS